jgi:hypothetical protein
MDAGASVRRERRQWVRPRPFKVRTIAVGSCLLALLAGCSSSGRGSSASRRTGNATTSTIDPELLTPNSVPFAVGYPTGLPNGWRVTITKVHRPYAASGLPALPAGRQYVAVDIAMDNEGTTHSVNAARVFSMVDGSQPHFAVTQRGQSNGVDGTYEHGTKRAGRLVFVVPTAKQLGLVLYGPAIGTKVSNFAIDPPSPS